MLSTNTLELQSKYTQLKYDSICCYSEEKTCNCAQVKGINIEYWKKNGEILEKTCIVKSLFDYLHHLMVVKLNSFVKSNGIKGKKSDGNITIKVGCLWDGNKIGDIIFRELCYNNPVFMPVLLNYTMDDPEIISYKLFVAKCQILLFDVDIPKSFIDEISNTFSTNYDKKILLLASDQIFDSNCINRNFDLIDYTKYNFVENNVQEPIYSDNPENSFETNKIKNTQNQEDINPTNQLEGSIIDHKFKNIEKVYLKLGNNFSEKDLKSNQIIFDPDIKSRIRNIVFTSGSTGRPKGVKLTFGNYLEMMNTFGVLYKNNDNIKSVFVITNPLHHINSTCFTEYCIRNSSKLVLIHRYSREYWLILNETIKNSIDNYGQGFIIIVPLVPKHFEYFCSMIQNNYFEDKNELLINMSHPSVYFFFGSSAVSDDLINKFKELLNGKIPRVRFGSTETCLQLCGTDLFMNNSLLNTTYGNGSECSDIYSSSAEKRSGHFIGRSIQPFAEIIVVKSIDYNSENFLVPTNELEIGHIICRGKTVMNGYINHENVLVTKELIRRRFDSNLNIKQGKMLYICDTHPWYIGLGDQGYWAAGGINSIPTPSTIHILGEEREIIHISKDPKTIIDEKLNSCACCDTRIFLDNIFLFWLSRSSSIIKIGGVKYSSEEINNRIVNALKGLKNSMLPKNFSSAVIGNKDDSISKDDRILFIYEPFEGGKNMEELIKSEIMKSKIPKSYIPYKIIETNIPRTFKGSINYEKLLEKINNETCFKYTQIESK